MGGKEWGGIEPLRAWHSDIGKCREITKLQIYRGLRSADSTSCGTKESADFGSLNMRNSSEKQKEYFDKEKIGHKHEKETQRKEYKNSDRETRMLRLS